MTKAAICIVTLIALIEGVILYQQNLVDNSNLLIQIKIPLVFWTCMALCAFIVAGTLFRKKEVEASYDNSEYLDGILHECLFEESSSASIRASFKIIVHSGYGHYILLSKLKDIGPLLHEPSLVKAKEELEKFITDNFDDLDRMGMQMICQRQGYTQWDCDEWEDLYSKFLDISGSFCDKFQDSGHLDC